MHLLEFIDSALSLEQQQLAAKLLYQPWECRRQLLQDHLPPWFIAQFTKAQQTCRNVFSNKSALWRMELDSCRLLAYRASPHEKPERLDANGLHALEQFTGMAREDLAKRNISFDRLPDSAKAAILLTYILADAALYLLAGALVGDQKKFHLRRSDNPRLRDALKLQCFSQYWCFQSNISDMHLRDVIVSELLSEFGSVEAGVRRKSLGFNDFVCAMLDKYLSLNEDFISHFDNQRQQAYRTLKRRTELICFIFLKIHSATRNVAPETLYMQAYAGSLRPNDFIEAGYRQDEVFSLIKESADKIDSGDALLTWEDEEIKICKLNLKYALITYLRNSFLAIRSGNWFDEKYIFHYVSERTNNPRFTFGKGFKPGPKNEGKFDIDLLIADHAIDRIYFCQIKHRIDTLLPYFRDEITEYTTNEQWKGAIRQLKEIQPQFENQKFIERLKDSLRRGGAPKSFLSKICPDFLKTNSAPIIIHSIENFDFCRKEGIAMYEWNTFRNLLRERIHTRVMNFSRVAKLGLSRVALDDTAEIAQTLMKWHETALPDHPYSWTEQWNAKEFGYIHLFPRWRLKAFGFRGPTIAGKDFRYPLM